MKMLTIDPSVNNVGWSLFNSSAKDKTKAWKWGTWKLDGNNLQMRQTLLVQLIQTEVGGFDLLTTEKPAFFSSQKGMIAAHQNYTIDLAAMNYFVAGWFRMDHRHHYAITATQWKGTVSKEVTARRFFRAFEGVNPVTLSEHAIDAVMLARFTIQQYLSADNEDLLALI